MGVDRLPHPDEYLTAQNYITGQEDGRHKYKRVE